MSPAVFLLAGLLLLWLVFSGRAAAVWTSLTTGAPAGAPAKKVGN